MNAVDFAAFINALHLMGNQQAELMLTTDKGHLPTVAGTRICGASWTTKN